MTEGTNDRLRLKLTDCEPPITIFHTHPNGVTRLSGQDASVLADERIESVCAANADPEDPKFRCERLESCEYSP